MGPTSLSPLRDLWCSHKLWNRPLRGWGTKHCQFQESQPPPDTAVPPLISGGECNACCFPMGHSLLALCLWLDADGITRVLKVRENKYHILLIKWKEGREGKEQWDRDIDLKIHSYVPRAQWQQHMERVSGCCSVPAGVEQSPSSSSSSTTCIHSGAKCLTCIDAPVFHNSVR